MGIFALSSLMVMGEFHIANQANMLSSHRQASMVTVEYEIVT